MIYSEYTRKIRANILNYGITENEINLYYFINQGVLKICCDVCELNSYVKFSLTNFNQLLSFIKNDYEFKNSRASNKIKNIEIYV